MLKFNLQVSNDDTKLISLEGELNPTALSQAAGEIKALLKSLKDEDGGGSPDGGGSTQQPDINQKIVDYLAKYGLTTDTPESAFIDTVKKMDTNTLYDFYKGAKDTIGEYDDWSVKIQGVGPADSPDYYNNLQSLVINDIVTHFSQK